MYMHKNFFVFFLFIFFKSYTEDEYYGGVFGRKRRKKKKEVIKAPKQPALYDFQFYPDKLKPLLQKELDIWRVSFFL